ncbi:MAG: hypothetical protein K2Y22_08565 [Candidatus Obscuribacterales bacterium]|nr:hypothetical protein [Candidatus Obscuribacterales bacterium]
MDTTTNIVVVRTMNLSNLEALLNIVANFAELIGITGGILLIISFCRHYTKNKTLAIFRLKLALVFIASGLSTPGTVNYLVATARDANLFS